MGPTIVFLDETADLGGGEINLLQIAASLSRSGRVIRFVLPRVGPLSRSLANAKVPVEIVPCPHFASSSIYIAQQLKLPNLFGLAYNILVGCVWSLRLASALRTWRPCVLHTGSLWSHLFGGMSAHLAGCPAVWHVQEIARPSSGFGTYRAVLQVAARLLPTRIICVSSAVADQFVHLQAVAHKVTTLPNAIDMTRFHADALLGSAQDSGGPLRIATVGRFTPWKGQTIAVAAAKLIDLLGIAFAWELVGDETLGNPGYLSHVTRLICRAGLSDRVCIKGWIQDMPAFYRTIHVLVHVPKEIEPFGLVVSEALAMGTPVVVSSNVALAEHVEGLGGYVVPPNDPKAVAAALLKLSADRPSVEERLERARRAARLLLGTEEYRQRLEEVYQTL